MKNRWICLYSICHREFIGDCLKSPPVRPYQISVEQKALWTFLFGTMLFTAIIGNSIVIWIVLGRNKRRRRKKTMNKKKQKKRFYRRAHCMSVDIECLDVWVQSLQWIIMLPLKCKGQKTGNTFGWNVTKNGSRSTLFFCFLSLFVVVIILDVDVHVHLIMSLFVSMLPLFTTFHS